MILLARVAVRAALFLSIPCLAFADGTDASLLNEGKALYADFCASCHGAEGLGDGEQAGDYQPRPRNLVFGNFKFRSTELGQGPTQADLSRTIQQGIEGSYGRSMPAFDHLSPRQQNALVEVVRDFAALGDFPSPVKVPPRPAQPDLELGRVLYDQMQCVGCHGANGDGKGVLASDLRDADNLALRPTSFKTGQFKGGNAPEDIWMRIYTGLDGTPMPSFGRNLTDNEIWALVFYVRLFASDG